ncbi:MAG: hypothetical protein ACFFDN_12845, partial [Candidatus Hodarchaeota archaeon]
MRRKSLAILVICIVIIMNFFIIAQNQYIPPSSDFNENKPENLPAILPILDELPPLGTSDEGSYPERPNEIDSTQNVYLSDYYYRYKEFVFKNINNTLAFIFQNSMNTNDSGFYEYVGAQNNTIKYTSTNALMVISLVDVYLNNKTLNYFQGANETYLPKANETMEFMLNNLYFNTSVDGLTGFVNYINDTGTDISNEIYSSDNALAIIALLKLYQVTKNTKLLDIANQTLTYMNQELWDPQYYGYYKSNDTSDISKYTIDNLIAVLMNLEVYNTHKFDYEYQINALRKAENIIDKILDDFNILNGLVLNYSRDWSIKIFGNQSYVNSLGILTLLELSQSTVNDTYVRIAENISNFLWQNFYDEDFQGLNDSISDTTKYLETNSWAIHAFLELFEETQNVTYYLQARKVSYFINNHLWDNNNKIYNYSIDSGASAQNSTIKHTKANSIAILGLLKFRFPNYYLTRANTTMRILLEHLRADDVGFYNTLSRDHDPYITNQFEAVRDDFLAIITLIELSLETDLTYYISNTSIEIYNRLNSTFYNSTEGYYKIGMDKDGDLISKSSLIENTYALLTLSELYKITNNTAYLQEINKTWHYVNNTLWYNVTGGYYNISSETTTQINRNSFDHFLIILANLEVANVAKISGIYPYLERNATKMANITLQIINENMWDNVSGGFYTSANTNWVIDSASQNKIDAKRLDTNSLSILVHLRYLELFPGDINSSLYSNRTNSTLSFIENTFWDSTLGGFFDYSNHNGTVIGLNKSTYDNCWAILAYSKLFENTNNYSYYSKSEEVLNFLNLYLWDYGFGGYFTRYYYQEVDLRDNKKPRCEFMAIRALVALSKNRKQLEISPLINIFINSSKLDSLGRYVDANITIYDTDGNKLENADVKIFLSGFLDNKGLRPIYGLGQKFNFTSNNSNIYNFNLNFSPYYGRIYLNPFILNELYSASWNLILSNRSFSTYTARVFTTINSLTLGFYDYLKSGFYNTNGTKLNKSAEENFYALYTLLDFFSSTGLNIAINWQEIVFDQIMLKFILNTSTFLYNQFQVGNDTFMGFISKTDNNGTHISNITQCKDIAWAILASLELYETLNLSVMLDIANSTWNYLNLTFWDKKNDGYNSTNSTSQNIKNLYDNFLAILANLAIASNNQINQTIRTQALRLANFTLNKIVSKLWNSSIYGFYSKFNCTWHPVHEFDEYSTIINSLAILTIIEYLNQTILNSTLYGIINKTSDFMLNYLWDSGFLGFFPYYNSSTGFNNTNKTLKDNSFAILAFSELYDFTKNYTHYINAEKIAFFINIYFWDPNFLAGMYTNHSSIFGYVEPKHQADTFSSLSICRALIKLYTLRLNLKNPPEASNFTVEQKIAGKIEDLYEIEIEIFDDTGIRLKNATAFAIVYGIDQIFIFNNTLDNLYKTIINISRLSFNIYVNVLIFNEYNFTAGFYTFVFYREFPIYIQIAHDALKSMIDYLWTDEAYADGFTSSITLRDKYSLNNFMILESISNLYQLMGPIMYSPNWYANNTYDKLIDRIYTLLNTTLRANEIVYINNSIVEANVTGFVTHCDEDLQNPRSETRAGDNAIAVLTLLELYNQTGNSEYLRRANETWLYLNVTFWDPVKGGYMLSNKSDANDARHILSNFLVILAGLQINQTIEINSNITQNAFKMANETFYLINNTKEIWDTNTSHEGGYLTLSENVEGAWNLTDSYKDTQTNAFGLLTLLKFYEITNNTAFLNQSYRLANLIFKYLWDSNNTGFYSKVLANWSLPLNEEILKYSLSNGWVLLAFIEFYEITQNYTIYYQIEKIMNYINSFYINFQLLDNIICLGYFNHLNKTNFIRTDDVDVTLDSNALLIKCLVKFFNLINSTFWNDTTSPWITDDTDFIPATEPPNGEIMNVTFSLKYNLTDNITDANVTLNIIGLDTVEGITYQTFIYRVNATFNSSSNNLYIAEFINISTAEKIIFCIFGINTSSPAFWKVYYIERWETSLDYLFFYPTSPVAIKNKRPLPVYVPHDDH